MPSLSTPVLTRLSHILARLIDQLRLQTLTPDGDRAVARFTDIEVHAT